LELLACSVLSARWPVLGEGDGVLHRLAVADLADQDHVGGLPQGFLERGFPRSRLSTPTSRCVIMQFLCGCTNSTGSSMVTMWPWLVFVAVADHRRERGRFARSPVAPTKITRPRLVIATSFIIAGSASGRRSSGWVGGDHAHHHAERSPSARSKLNAEAADVAGAMAKLHSLCASNSAACRSVHHRAHQHRGCAER